VNSTSIPIICPPTTRTIRPTLVRISAGATGTGKTVTLQCLAEGFSDLGVPVFLADIKGDLSGISQSGTPHRKVAERVQKIGMEHYQQRGYPVAFWDLFGKKRTPIRSTISEMGPQLISRLLDLNETQESVITLLFEFADSEGMLLLDLKDLRTTLEYLGNNSRELGAGFDVSKASVNPILRRLLMLEREGADHFFGEPALQLRDFMRTGLDGRGMINILAADTLIMNPRVYSTFLLWLLSELFEELPELGDPEQPVLARGLNQQRYVTPIDPHSAQEILLERTAARQKQAQEANSTSVRPRRSANRKVAPVANRVPEKHS
jgi:DNA helicase HerA-like ATPase